MKKISFLIISALTASLLMTGCSEDKKTQDKPDADSVTEATAATSASEAATEPSAFKPSHNIEKAEGTYVYDYAKVLSAEDFAECNNYAEWIYENHLLNTAVVITDSIDGLTPEEYAENAYIELYGGKGSGFLLLINNDTNEDFLYKTGGCAVAVPEKKQSEEFYRATQEIVTGNYKNAVMRLLGLAESCPKHIFDNGGVFTAEELTALEASCEAAGVGVSVLATSNNTGSTNEEICSSYHKRRYSDGNGIMIMLDTVSASTAVVGNLLPANVAQLKETADALMAEGNRAGAVNALIEGLKG